jgi:gliding motility-associated-like protein
MKLFKFSKIALPTIAKVFLFLLILFLPRLVSAQVDQKFWFAAPYVDPEGRDFDKPIVVRVTTMAAPATVTISIPANAAFTPIVVNIPANSTSSVDLTTWISLLETSPANTALNKGLLIQSTADITAYYESVSSDCNTCDPEVFSLKGKNSLGTEFFISSQYTYDESGYYNSSNSFDIVATADNTHITITPSQNIVGHAANVPFTITLNMGQTYSATASSVAAAGHLQGSYVTSDNPIAVTLKDDLVQVSSCADLIGDQTVPTSVLGTEYIVTKGYLNAQDEVYILAVTDGTSIYIDGSTTPTTVLAKGQSYTLNLSDASTYITSSQNIYVYQLTGNGCETGSAIIPKLSCTGSQSVSIVRSNSDMFAVMITTKNGNQNNFSVNGNTTLIPGSAFAAVPGTGGAYVTAKVDLSSSATVGSALNFSNTTGLFSLGFINGGTNDGVVYGYFSDFKSSNVENSTVQTCPSSPVQLTAYGGVTYSWSPTTALSNPNIANPLASPAVTTDYKVTITSADGCIDYANVHVAVTGALIPTVTIAASANNICSGSPVTFTATPVNGGTTPAYQWQVNGINAGVNSPTFSSNSLANGDKVTCIITSNATCVTSANVTSNTITMVINADVTPSVSIVASQNNICAGTSVSFTATPANGGSAPIYQWQVNGVNAGTNSTTFTSTTLASGDKVTCIITSNAPCTTQLTSTSNIITTIVDAYSTPSVSIVASTNNICPGTAVSFTATPVNGGSAPIYQWQVNGINAGTNSSTFTSANLVNGDKITCILTSNVQCVTPATVTSNIITMAVNINLAPTISIATSTNSICTGSTVNFTATPVNGGSAPVYQWQVNGLNAGTNSATFTSATLANGDKVTCIITSNSPCVAVPMATSNTITMSVNAYSTPTVSIIASANNICSGVAVSFTATPVNGGSAPVYQWQVNGVNAGTNSATFTSTTLANGDKVVCIMTSNTPCAAPVTITSNTVTMIVNAYATPSVSIAASTNNICPGTTVNFTATPVNGGTAPVYQWQVNNVNAGTNSAIFSSTTLANGDKVVCIMTSNVQCIAPATATSNTISMSVTSNLPPSISVAAITNNICPGSAISFIATSVNGGSSPVYQWQVNGVNAGTNSPVFESNTFNNGDVVSCIITSNNVCAAVPTAISNSIIVNVNPAVNPTVTITASASNICSGTPVTFTATSNNGGTYPIYQWIINGNNVGLGTNNNTFISNNLSSNDIITCQLSSSANCAVPQTKISNSITMVVNQLPVVNGGGDKIIKKGDKVVLNATTSGNIADITWSPATGLDNTKILTPTASPDKTTFYTITVQSVDGCVATDMVKVTVQENITIPNTFTPNGDGVNDTWDIKNLIDYSDCSVQIFNRWGQEVYQSKGYYNAWDGTYNGKPLPPGTYYYVIKLGNGTKPLGGWVALIR